MAEPTERPGPAGSGTAPAEQLVYQPVSLLAIAGLAAAAVYGVVVLVGFVAATLFSTPWQMSTWTLVFPLISLGLSLVARSRIQRSEGTLAGLALANWGITLSVLFGLIFLSYTTATYFVLRHQAESFTQRWFDDLKAGKVDQAFCLTIPAENRPAEGPQLRSDLEVRFNTPGEMGRKGPFGQFLQKDEVRRIVQGGPDTEVQLLGINDWTYHQGGYLVQQTYRVATPECTFELLVPVHGMTNPQKKFQGRQWRVMDGVSIQKLKPSEQGQTMQTLRAQAQEYATGWVELLRTGRVEDAYLYTRETAEREGLIKTYRQRVPFLSASVPATLSAGDLPSLFAGLACLAAQPELGLPGFRGYVEGGFLRADADHFWPAPKRPEVLEAMRKFLQRPGGGLLVREPVSVLPWKVDGDRLQVRQDVVITLPDRHQVDGALVLECDAKAIAKAIAGAPATWQVAGLELLRARSLTADGPGGEAPKKIP